MDLAKTAPFTLGPPATDARVAVLLLHGLSGSPWDLRLLGESLAARGAHVFCPRLPGHGTTPDAMRWAGAPEWLEAARAALDRLTAAPATVVAGLSMGGLLSLILAGRYPARVRGLVLMAPAVKLKGRDARLLRRLRHFTGPLLSDRWITKDSTDIEDATMRSEAPILEKYPLTRVLDLFALQELALAELHAVRCPSLVLAARHDHVVEYSAVKQLQERLPFSRFLSLERGFHIIPRDTERALALSAINRFIGDLTG